MTDSTSAPGTAAITGYNVSNNIVTFYTTSNGFLSGTSVSISGLSTTEGQSFNGKKVVVLATGLSSTQFEVSLTAANTSGTVSDIGYAAQNFVREYTFTQNSTNYCTALYTQNTFTPIYGYFEAALRYTYQTGAQAGWWLKNQAMSSNPVIGNPQQTGMEYDIFEHSAWTTSPTTYDHNIFWNGYNLYERTLGADLFNMSNLNDGNFHRFGLAWTPSGVTFYVDGVANLTLPPGSMPVSDAKEFLILDNELPNAAAIPSGGYGTLGASTNPSYDYAYVRVYPYAYPTAQAILSATQDAYVADASPSTNYGSSTTLNVQYGSSGSRQNSYLQFNLSSVLGKVQQATLYLTPTSMGTLSCAITGYSVSSNVVTFYTASNSFSSGSTVVVGGLSTAEGLTFNGQQMTVLSTGLSSSQFQVSYSASSTAGTVTDSGTASTAFITNALYSVSNNSWTESGITWSNQPQTVTSSTTPVSTSINYGTGILTNFDATAPAQSVTGSSPLLSLEISGICSVCTSNNSNYQVQYASRTNGTTSYQPSLMLVTIPGLSYSPSSISFGSQPQGVTSAAQTITVTNNGLATITFSAIVASSPFAQTNNCSPTLASGASCTVNVTFTPTSIGTASGNVTFSDNDPGTTQTVALSGTGTSGPIPSLSPSSLSFGNVTVNTTSSSQAVTLSNSASAGAALTSISISITGTNASQFSQTNNCPTSLAVGTSCTINVSFTPSAAASASASLSVSDNYTSSPQTSTLSGTGTAIVPTITWNPSSTTGYTGAPIGSGVLDASASTAGTFAYTATPSGGSASSITASSGLSTATTYTLTANFTPTSNNYTTASATKTFTVVVQHVWVVNTSGSLGGLDDGGNAYISSATSGGGTGAAVDNSGNIWTINISGASLAKFSKTGTIVSSSFTGGGLSSAAALAIDGSNQVWVANGNGSLSLFNSSGVAQSPSTGFAPGALSTPTGIAIDNAGSLWVSNGGNNSVTEVIGAASPVITPTQAAVQNITLGVKP